MVLFHILTLAIVQGLTEFLPISSSAHLILVHQFFEQKNLDENLLLDVSVHIGTLLSLIVYFYKDILQMLTAIPTMLTSGTREPIAGQNIMVLIASIPVFIVGYVMVTFLSLDMRSVQLLAINSIVFGLILWAADCFGKQTRRIEDIGYKDALLIGFAQSLSLIPGVSRSGITMTTGRFLGISRLEAARFSMFLSMVAISGAGVLTGLHLLEDVDSSLWLDAIFGVIFSFIASLAALIFMMRWLKKFSFLPFVIYRVVLGFVLLSAIYGGYLA